MDSADKDFQESGLTNTFKWFEVREDYSGPLVVKRNGDKTKYYVLRQLARVGREGRAKWTDIPMSPALPGEEP